MNERYTKTLELSLDNSAQAQGSHLAICLVSVQRPLD